MSAAAFRCRLSEADLLGLLREQIAEADAEILAAFTRRVEATVRLGSGLDPAVAELVEANGKTVGDLAVRELFSVVLTLTRREAARTRLTP